MSFGCLVRELLAVSALACQRTLSRPSTSCCPGIGKATLTTSSRGLTFLAASASGRSGFLVVELFLHRHVNARCTIARPSSSRLLSVSALLHAFARPSISCIGMSTLAAQPSRFLSVRALLHAFAARPNISCIRASSIAKSRFALTISGHDPASATFVLE